MNMQIGSFANTLFTSLNVNTTPTQIAMDLLKIFGGENAFNAAGLADALSQLRQNDPAMAGAVETEIDRQLSPLQQGQLAREGAAFDIGACKSENSTSMRAGDRNSAANANYPNDIAAHVAKGGTRIGPVPGWRDEAVKGDIGPNGKPYSDGRFSIDGKERYRILDGKGKPHKGIDIPAKYGDPVYAAASGKVIEVRENKKGYGLLVVIDHQDGTSTMYAHLSVQGVKYGQDVKIGQVIGNVGTSGNGDNKGEHLHFEAMKTPPNSKVLASSMPRFDPTVWIEAGGRDSSR